MNYLNQDDEEDQKPLFSQPDPSVAAPALKSLADRYAAASDTSGLKAARSDADDRNMWVNIMRGVGQMATAPSVARGGKGIDNSAFDSFIGQNNAKVAQAEQDRKNAMDSVLTGDKLSWQDKEHGQQQRQWDINNKLSDVSNDPNSDISKSYQSLAEKMSGAKPGDYAGRSAAQLEGVMPSLGTVYKATMEKEGREAAINRPRQVKVTNADGTTSVMMVDPASMTATSVQGAGGVTAPVIKAGMDAKAADAATGALTGAKQGYMDLYDAADKEGGVGPSLGRVAAIRRDFGYSAGPNTDKIQSELQQDLTKKMHDTFGSRLTKTEIGQALKFMPSANQTRDAFGNSFDAMIDTANRLAAQKHAALPGSGVTPAAAVAPVIDPGDSQAMQWLQNNPDDENAPQVRAKLVKKGLLKQ